MGLSFKELTTSMYGKVLTGVLTLGAGSAMSHDAEAAEITTITQNAAALCIGSDMGGTIYGEKLGWKGTLTDGKSTGFSTTDDLVIQGQMDNPLKGYQASTHRNYAIAKWPANNGMVEGYYLYDIGDVNNIKQKFVINSKNYPDYKESTRIHFVKGATPDQDQMVFLNDTIKVYKSPFNPNGTIKPESKTGPIMPDFTYKIISASHLKAIENSIFLLADNGIDSTIQKLIVGKNVMTEDKIVVLKGIDVYNLPFNDGFVTMKDANGTPTTYLTVNGNTLILVNVDNTNDYKVTDANEIAVEDPQGRYAFKSIEDGAGNLPNLDTYVTDLWAKPNVNKKIITNNVFPLRGNLSYADGFPTPAWVLYGRHDDWGTNDKAYLIELLDAATMNVKVTEIPFTVFKDKYIGGGEACVTIPGQVATVVKTGTPADAGDASVVENANEGASEGAGEGVVEAVEAVEVVEKDMDAGTTEGVDGGGTDVAAEVVITPEVDGGSDAIDAWLDGKGDMSDISTDVAPDGEPDTMADQSSDTAEIAVAAEVDGEVLPPDMSTNEIVSVDTQTNDTAVPPVDTQKADAGITGDVGNMEDTLDGGAKSETNSGSETSRKPPVIAPSPKDTGCNATGTGNGNNGLTPLAIALGVGAAVGLARRREAVRLDSGIDNV